MSILGGALAKSGNYANIKSLWVNVVDNYRDSMAQKRLPIDNVGSWSKSKPTLLRCPASCNARCYCFCGDDGFSADTLC